MESSVSELTDTFAKELAQLGGNCYAATSIEDVARIVIEITSKNNCVMAVKQSLRVDDENLISSELRARGIHVTELEEDGDSVESLSQADMAITRADLLVAQTGTLVIYTEADEDRLASCLPRIHVAIIPYGNIVNKPQELGQRLENTFRSRKAGAVTLISGPSRTSDIEMKQILGVHGPHQVHVIILKR